MALPRIAGSFAAECQIPMSYQDWLVWAGDSTRLEWVDGEAIVFKPTKEVHAGAVWFLATLIGLYARVLDLGRVFASEFEMRVVPGRSSRQPDVLFIATANLDRLTADRLDGAADLVVELVSDDSVSRDRVTKFAEYAAVGVPEYWIFDPRPGKQTSDFYRFNDRGAYEAVSLDADGRYHSEVLPGIWFDPAWHWADPQPNPLLLLVDMAPAAVRAMIRSD